MQPREGDQSPVLEIRELRTYFPVAQTIVARMRNGATMVRAVDGVSLTVHRGETVELVGESGCSKSTLGRSVLRLVEPTSGEVRIEGLDVVRASSSELQAMRRRAQIIFQDPASSLNPRRTVGQILEEPLAIFNIVERGQRKTRVTELLRQVGLPPDAADRFPHSFRGGQRQRVGIAAALALEPAVIVADEPTSALDVSVQAQILNLLEQLQQSLGLAYLFISHNLEVVRHISDRVAVMYLGKIVELAPTERLFDNPLHPYTQALMSAIPNPDPMAPHSPMLLEGEVPSPLNPPAACRFHPRCPISRSVCSQIEPELTADSDGHAVACHAVTWGRLQQQQFGIFPDVATWRDDGSQISGSMG